MRKHEHRAAHHLDQVRRGGAERDRPASRPGLRADDEQAGRRGSARAATVAPSCVASAAAVCAALVSPSSSTAAIDVDRRVGEVAQPGRRDRDRERAALEQRLRRVPAGRRDPGSCGRRSRTRSRPRSFAPRARGSPSGVEALSTTKRGTSGSPSQAAPPRAVRRPRARRAARGRARLVLWRTYASASEAPASASIRPSASASRSLSVPS